MRTDAHQGHLDGNLPKTPRPPKTRDGVLTLPEKNTLSIINSTEQAGISGLHGGDNRALEPPPMAANTREATDLHSGSQTESRRQLPSHTRLSATETHNAS